MDGEQTGQPHTGHLLGHGEQHPVIRQEYSQHSQQRCPQRQCAHGFF